MKPRMLKLQRKSIFVWKFGPTLIANCSAHRSPPGMFQYSMKRYCRQDSKKYDVNVRGGLGPEQFAFEVGPVFLKNYGLSL